ncbi:uncharacterized protein BDR25DRAFT_391618 [Lindgomyces ingoldianus]|uniref:Uncharacterized protein n=1 Tax=Lindgomyces ingoldianus TaxID=673940 RepID=A0ACB6R8I4_9PLEO|nr:uncharacterized protein BDR25DRAFT_391618 [Lindgomyces ingoldianus]KAF2475574.1 hypothetical protein BDR25DRAFT_391618 [Lindgomyces ingoldianus]
MTAVARTVPSLGKNVLGWTERHPSLGSYSAMQNNLMSTGMKDTNRKPVHIEHSATIQVGVNLAQIGFKDCFGRRYDSCSNFEWYATDLATCLKTKHLANGAVRSLAMEKILNSIQGRKIWLDIDGSRQTTLAYVDCYAYRVTQLHSDKRFQLQRPPTGCATPSPLSPL